VKIVGKVVLTFVIPAVLLGYNLIEGSSMFKSFLGTSQTEKFLKTMLLTQYDEQPGPRILSRKDHPNDFEAVWGLIRTNSSAKLRQTPPYLISRIVVENGASVTLPTEPWPTERKVILIPEATPLFALYCPYVQNCPTSESVLVGSVGDLRS
jgi:hypothetical protein